MMRQLVDVRSIYLYRFGKKTHLNGYMNKYFLKTMQTKGNQFLFFDSMSYMNADVDSCQRMNCFFVNNKCSIHIKQ